MKTRTLIYRLVLGLLLMVSTLAGYQKTARAQETALVESPYQEQVAALMEQMDVRDRVGQLFLVTFVGDQATPDSAIADLILNYRIGGVVLLAANDNITDDDDPPTQVAGLINDLQTRAYEVSLQERLPAAEGEISPSPSPFVPLLVAIDHEGDNSPFTRLLTGMTEIPSSMAIGATWNTAHAQTVGRIVGAELSALGINMVLGPSLDVLETPRPESPGGLGTRTFGGDPYWVGMMGQAYIAGVHEGSNNQIAVVAKHFPGHGGSDRQPDQEVSTVRKSLGELRLIELAPFVSVTGGSSVPTDTADALMTSHIRYQGFQGNIRESTRPISFDPQALETIMELPEFAAWRSAGGVIVSDALGVRAVKRFYDPQLQEFPHRQIAQDAFLAGNDVLLLSEFAITSNYVDQVANIKDTLDWFYDNYANDAAFQARVDRSVERILNLKLGLYDGDISVDSVLVPVSQVADQVGNRRDEIVLLAQDAITLLAPGPEELADRIPSPPNKNDYVTIFTDLRYARQCTTCQDRPLVSVNELQNAILRLYGPDGTNQVLPGHLNSFSFQELEEFLQTPPAPPVPTATPEGEENTGEQEPTPEPPPLIETALERADWIIFAMLDVAAQEPQSDAVKTFLAERPDIASNARIIVLAFNAPYFLDTTDISKLTAYYGIYSKIEPFVEASVKAVFQQFKPPGSPPVDIMGTGYKLTEATSSSPDQIIQLFFDQENGQGDSSAEPPDLRVGDSLRLRTGIILDNNGNPVPDGTPVQFTISYLSEGLGFDVPQPEVHTVDGTARISILLNVPGQLQIKASSGDARASVGLAVTVFEDQPPIIEEITPLPTNTPSPPPPTPTQTATPLPATPTPTPTATPTSTPAPIIVPWVGPEEYPMRWYHLSGAMVGILLVGLLGLWLGFVVSDRNLVWGLRLALMGVVAGLLGYNYLALQLPGTEQVAGWAGVWGVPLMAWGTGLCGVAAGWIWLSSTDLEAERDSGPGRSLRDQGDRYRY